jgi:hypothetical protein
MLGIRRTPAVAEQEDFTPGLDARDAISRQRLDRGDYRVQIVQRGTVRG